MRSMVTITSEIKLPKIIGHHSMIPFDLQSFDGLNQVQGTLAKSITRNITGLQGKAYLTIHGKILKSGDTLRRGGAHTDGNYEKYYMSFSGGGWKVGENGPPVGSKTHKRQYIKETGGIIMASNYVSCIGWVGEYNDTPRVGGDCSHIKNLGESFELNKNTIYYGNNHFIHESLPVQEDVHRVFIRITLPENHIYQPY